MNNDEEKEQEEENGKRVAKESVPSDGGFLVH